VIVLSSKEDPIIKAKAFELGANDYLVKPPERMELIARIRYHSNAYLNFSSDRKLKDSLKLKFYVKQHILSKVVR
jgi:sigma-B regulation protein RsbU (phosphoserine phosphatase)